jgi:hypothetical protein
MDATATVSVEQAADPGAAWIEEAIAYSLGKSPLARRVERWLLDPVFRVLVRRKSNRALRCLAERLAQGAGAEPGAEPGTAPDRGGVWVFRGPTLPEPPQQVSLGVGPTRTSCR